MAASSFGDYLKSLRAKHHEVMGDSAKLFGVSLPFMSAVENGKKKVPAGWYERLVEYYQLSKEEQKKLLDAIEDSSTQIKINLNRSQNYQREMAIQFQRSFDNIDEEAAKKIMDILKNTQGE
ncbi:MAG: helix-turn-helix domain-containing protein [Anaerolineaceae bacterium]|nr:helix-turn-helix domain-containing protein [Anaerolineaceae bacterium]